MSPQRLPISLRPALRWLTWLLLALALPVAAQLQTTRPITAPKPIERINPQIRPPVNLMVPRAEAEAIALASPSVREAARRLRQGGQAADASLAAVRSVFRAPDRDSYQALVAAGYARPELIDALKKLDKADAASLRAKLSEVGEMPRDAAIALARLFPTLGFDELFALVKTNASLDDAFASTIEALALGVDQIVTTSARYQQSRQYQIGSGRFFPEPGTTANLVRSRHPGTPQGQVWARLLTAGFEPLLVFQQVAIGDFDRSGRALDAVAGCIVQRFPGRIVTTNPIVEVAIGIDGSGSHDARQSDCYATFLQSLRTQSVSRTVAAQLLDTAVACMPAEAAGCETHRQPVIASILDGAGYKPDRR